MVSDTHIRQAFSTCQQAYVKMNPSHPRAAMLLGAIAAMGWILEENVYHENFAEVLKEIRSKGMVLDTSTPVIPGDVS